MEIIRLVMWNSDLQKSIGKIRQLNESAQVSRFPFRTDRFPQAVIVIKDDNRIHASQKALMEIDRTLDTLVFTWFSQCKYLPVGYVRNVETNEVYPIQYEDER